MSKSLSTPLRMMAPLSDEETGELEQFLMSDLTSDETLMLDSLDGYLTAIAIGPANLGLSEWLPGIWGRRNGDAPDFESMEQAQRILNLILRYYNGIVVRLSNPDAFTPVFDKVAYRNGAREYIEGEPWALGFMDGVALCRRDWQPLFDDAQGQEWVRPLHLLGADNLTPEEEALTRWPHQREELAKQIPASIAAIYRYWAHIVKPTTPRARRIQPSTRNVGLRDPYPRDSDVGHVRLGMLKDLPDIAEGHAYANKAFKTKSGGGNEKGVAGSRRMARDALTSQ